MTITIQRGGHATTDEELGETYIEGGHEDEYDITPTEKDYADYFMPKGLSEEQKVGYYKAFEDLYSYGLFDDELDGDDDFKEFITERYEDDLEE